MRLRRVNGVAQSRQRGSITEIEAHSDRVAGRDKIRPAILENRRPGTSVKAKGLGAQEPAMTEPGDPEDSGFKPPMTARRETPPTWKIGRLVSRATLSMPPVLDRLRMAVQAGTEPILSGPDNVSQGPINVPQG